MRGRGERSRDRREVDRPKDGPRLDLPAVTLLTVTSVAIDASAQAVAHCLDKIRFGAALWISDIAPPALIADRVDWHPIEPISSRHAYSHFMLHDLHRYLETSHALCVQWDGFVLDPGCWMPTFMDYDYIGAPWPQFSDGHDVGNGGFSLRSARLLQACSTLPETPYVEDVAICRVHRAALERDHGIRYAPALLAARFSFERTQPDGSTFGFHGPFNLVNLLPDGDAAAIVDALERHIMAPMEHREILARALRTGRWRLALAILQRWRRLSARF